MPAARTVLLTGASGFVGRRLRAALLARGHAVVAIARRPPAPDHPNLRWHALDLAVATDARQWEPLLDGVTVVVNAAGIFRESAAARFEAVHARSPIALFDACARCAVQRVVQLSALSGTPPGRSRFIDSKRAADDALLRLLPGRGVLVRPSLVFGIDGQSSRLLLTLASLPWLMLPGGGGRVQPVHVDDLVAALVALAEAPVLPTGGCIEAVGPRAMTLAEYLRILGAGLGRSPVRVLVVPVRWLAAMAGLMRGRWLARESLDLLQGGAQGDPQPFAALLGRPPREPMQFIDDAGRSAVRAQALLGWALPLLRLSLALVWIVTGLLSAGLYPVHESLALLEAVGVPPLLRRPMLYGAAALDLLLGLLTLWAPGRWLWRAQAALMLFYTAVLTLQLPAFWLHPFGPLLKNLPILAILVVLDAFEPRRAARPR